MKCRDETSMGGQNGLFRKTPWAEIAQARAEQRSRRDVALEGLLRNYWKPVYCYLRHKGFDNEHSKDLVQGFFHEVVLGRELIQQADPARGKFRTFLLTALDRYVANAHRDERAGKRYPAGRRIVPLAGMDPEQLYGPSRASTPQEAFHHVWASTMLDHALEIVEGLCRDHGQEVYWKVFHARVVRPLMENFDPPSLKELCEQYHLESASQASNMIITVKRRFQVILKRQVRKFVASDDEVDGEIRELIGILSERGAG